MKKILLSMLLITATPLYAQDLNFVNPASEDGVFKQMFDFIGSNIPHNFIQANNPVTAYTYLSSGESFTIWSSEWPGNPEFTSPEISEDNLVALTVYSTVMCSREFTSLEEMKDKDVKVATWGSRPAETFLSSFGEKNGINFVVVPYSGSGSTTKGYIAGDANTIFTVTSRQAAIEEDSKSTCFAFSENGDLDYVFVDAMITTNVDTSVTEQLRNKVNEVSSTEEWSKAFSGSKTIVADATNSLDLLSQFLESVKRFAQQ